MSPAAEIDTLTESGKRPAAGEISAEALSSRREVTAGPELGASGVGEA